MILNSKTRQVWAEKTFEFTNIGAGALLFGQFVSGNGFSILPTVFGLALVGLGYVISLALLSKKWYSDFTMNLDPLTIYMIGIMVILSIVLSIAIFDNKNSRKKPSKR